MEKLGPIPPPTASPNVAGVVMHGRGWALVHAETGFMLRLLSTGDEVAVKDHEVAALRNGTVSAETLLLRAGFALGSHPVPINATTVAFSAEAQRLSGQSGVAASARPAGKPGKSAPGGPAASGPSGLSVSVWVSVVAVGIVVALALIWGIGR